MVAAVATDFLELADTPADEHPLRRRCRRRGRLRRSGRDGPTPLVRSRRRSSLDLLSPRELEVLQLMAEGRANWAIATALHVSVGSAEKHIASIFAKLNLTPDETENRRVLAVLRYLES